MNSLLPTLLLAVALPLFAPPVPSHCKVYFSALLLQNGKGSVEDLEAFVRAQIDSKTAHPQLAVQTALAWAYKNEWPPTPAWAQRIGALLDQLPGAREELEKQIERVQELGSYAFNRHDESDLAGEWPIAVRDDLAYQEVTVMLSDGRTLRGKIQPAAGGLPVFESEDQKRRYVNQFDLMSEGEILTTPISQLLRVVGQNGSVLFDRAESPSR